ncbi:MAG TPA: exopolysaccharide biosynthesis polyprenyl glycosylphosphotransferase, partial [Rhodopila sp.]|nr:exopolysaccharide biosynthesis polyprenyl glycosylphosphotransferase [Rhodopila sp.]
DCAMPVDTIPAAPTSFGQLVSRWRFVACIQVFDLVIAFLAALGWFQAFIPSTGYHQWPLRVVLSILVPASTHCVFQYLGLYDFNVLTRGGAATCRALFGGVITYCPLMAPLLIKQGQVDNSVETAAGLVAVAILTMALVRLPLARLAVALQDRGIIRNRTFIVSDTAEAGVSLRLSMERSPETKVVGVWSLSRPGVRFETALDEVLTVLRATPVDVIILKMPLDQTERLADAVQALRTLPRKVLLAPTLGADPDLVPHLAGVRIDETGNTILVKLSDRPLAGWSWVAKDIQDRLLALLLLVIVAPVMLMIAIGIKLSDPGPVFFRQKRFGYRGDTFNIIKFRTMRVAPTAAPPGLGLKLTTRDDPRVFPFGRLLRKTSLDELPQLLNVIWGDMWVIGPRPHSPYATAGGEIYAKAVRGYAARYRIKPGITGWAQVCGWRGPTETQEQLSKRIQHDLYYTENWSLLFDVRILLKTLLLVFGQENAF